MNICVVIPCFKVRGNILNLISLISQEVEKIYVIDDLCPEGTGNYVKQYCNDDRVKVLYNDQNLGVGGAVMVGYKEAIKDEMEIIVKIDGDGQMDPSLIMNFVFPIINGLADYAKGNRFYDLESTAQMPKIRLFGNAILSFITKFSSGYWNIFDPTNGYTAIHAKVANNLPFKKISKRYFFETDMLFRLNTMRAVVIDIPMIAVYGNEKSNLRIKKVIGEFLYKNVKNFTKRIFYNYYLRDMSVASIELPLGFLLLIFGCIFGGFHWYYALTNGNITPAGTIMLAGLSILMGLQFILAFLSYDINNIPKIPLNILLSHKKNFHIVN